MFEKCLLGVSVVTKGFPELPLHNPNPRHRPSFVLRGLSGNFLLSKASEGQGGRKSREEEKGTNLLTNALHAHLDQ